MSERRQNVSRGQEWSDGVTTWVIVAEYDRDVLARWNNEQATSAVVLPKWIFTQGRCGRLVDPVGASDHRTPSRGPSGASRANSEVPEP